MNKYFKCYFISTLGCEATEKDLEYFKLLTESVIVNDIMVDKLIIKDVQVSCLKIMTHN